MLMFLLSRLSVVAFALMRHLRFNFSNVSYSWGKSARCYVGGIPSEVSLRGLRERLVKICLENDIVFMAVLGLLLGEAGAGERCRRGDRV